MRKSAPKLNNYMKGVGVGRNHQMGHFWAELSQLAVRNERNNVIERSATETIVGTKKNPHVDKQKGSHVRGQGQTSSMHGV